MIPQKTIRLLLKKIRVHYLMDWFFRTFPRKGQVGNFHYPVDSLESWLVEKEIFCQKIYDGVLDLSRVQTFADLGCNRGFFSLWLAAKTSRSLEGVLVEANPCLIPKITRLVAENQLSHFVVIHGAVGAGIQEREVEILVPPTDVGAGLAAKTCDSLRGDPCESFRVPALHFNKIWKENFPDGKGCDLLKVDIEGAEGKFFIDEIEFLSTVSQLVIEVHERMVDSTQIRESLKKLGFSILKESREDADTFLLFACRKSQG